MPSNNSSAKDNQILGFHDLPDEKELKKMSKLDLLSSLASYENDPMKFRYFKDELDRRKYATLSRANLTAIIIGAVTGAVFTVVGSVVITYYSNQSHSCVCDCPKE